MRKPIHPSVGSMVWVPRRHFPESGVEVIRKNLTATHHDPINKESRDVLLYKETPGGIYLPRAWVRDTLPQVWAACRDRTVKPKQDASLWPAGRIVPRDAKQDRFMRDVSALIKRGLRGEPVDTQIEAGTGTGKTVAMIFAAADNDISNLLIMVHRNNLRAQWEGSIELKKGLRFFFGEDWVERNVGIVQQDRAEWDKPIVIAMGPTLISRQYEDWVYRSRGVVFIDEVHKFAAPMLQESLSQFPAIVRVGATATLKKGSMGKVTNSHLGKPGVVSKQKALQPRVIVLKVRSEVNWWNYIGPENQPANVKSCDTKNMLLTFLPRLKDRTQLLAEVAYERGYTRGRHGLILADRVELLMDFRNRMIALGADEEQLGLYVGEWPTGEYKLTGKLVLQGGAIKHLRGLSPFKNRSAAEAYVRKLKPISQDIKIAKWMDKLTDADRDHMERNCSWILATYGIFDTGADVARLDWGMELTPRRDVEQAVGRILRIDEGKPVPVWYAVEDHITQNVTMLGSNVLKYKYRTPLSLAESRLTSYKNQNAIISVIGNPRHALDQAKAS